DLLLLGGVGLGGRLLGRRLRGGGLLGGGLLGGGLLGGGLLGGLLLGGGLGGLLSRSVGGGGLLGLLLGLLLGRGLSRSVGRGAVQELLLPLGERLGLGGLGAPAGLGGVAELDALGDGVGDHPGEQRDRADRVVVARDAVGDVIGVAVGVEDAHDGDAELLGLVDGEVLLVGVHDPHDR